MPIPKGSSAAWYRERREAGLCTACDAPRLPSTSRCSKCLYRSSPEQKRRTKLKARYGITPEQYDEMLAAQEGICPICLRPGVLVVDHCHTTGKVRGLIHMHCNTAIGQLNDNAATLRRAADYLEGKWRNSAIS